MSIIRIKRSGSAGNPSTLAAGELAYSALTDNGSNGGDRLYFGFGTETSGNAANHYIVGGKYYTDLMAGTAGTLNTAAKSVPILSSTGTIDKWYTGNIYTTANTISATNLNGNITLTPNGTGYVVISGTNGLVIPSGTTAQQGPAVTGAVRYNTTTSTFEGYASSTWSSLGGVRSVDGKAYIIAETSAGAGNDTLQFYASADGTSGGASTKYLDINGTGFKIGAVDFNINTNKFTVAAASGNTLVAGTLDATGSFAVATNKFTVAAATGNTLVAGTLNVTGHVTVESVTSTGATGTGKFVFDTTPTVSDLTGTGTTTLGNIAHVTNTISTTNTNGNLVLAPNGSGVVSISGSNGGSTGIQLGTPSLGTLAGAVTMTTSTSVTDGVAQLNQTLSLLTPAQPTPFATPNLVVSSSAFSQRIMFTAAGSQTNNDNTNITTAAAGTVVYVSRATDFTTTAFSAVAPGNTGTLTAKRNNATAVQKLLTYGNSTQTITVNVTATTTSSAIVSFNSTGVIVVGYQFTAGASAGGFISGNKYVVTAVTATTLTLANYSAGLQGSAFSGTTASGSPLVVLTSATDISTTTLNNTSIAITANPAFPASTPGFWETVDVQVTGTGVAAGWNSVQLAHSGTGTSTPYGANTTQNGVWYYDNSSTVAPTFASNSFALGTSNTINSSTIPHYTSSTTYNAGFVVTWNAGQTGHSSTASSIITTAAVGPWQSAGNKSYTALGYTTLPSTSTVTAGVGPNTSSFAVNVVTGFGAWTTTTTVPTFTADNSYTTGTSSLPSLGAIILYKTGTTGSTSFLEETNIFVSGTVGTGAGSVARVVNPDGGTGTDTPAFTAGASAFSTLLATDATVVGTGTGTHSLKHNVTNYATGYLPVGPDLSGRTAGNAQYFTFKFVRTALSKFGIVFTTNGSTTGIAGIWCAMPGTIAGYPSGSTNNWLSLAIDNSVSGGCALGGNLVVNGSNSTQTLNCSFGTASSSNATNNEIWVRVKLAQGQSISALYLQASTQ